MRPPGTAGIPAVLRRFEALDEGKELFNFFLPGFPLNGVGGRIIREVEHLQPLNKTSAVYCDLPGHKR